MTVADEDLPAPEAWAQFDDLLWAHVLAATADEPSEVLRELAADVQDGQRPSAGQVQDARRALDHARELVEEHYAELADGTEPWADGPPSTVPFGVMRECLEDFDP